MHMRLVLLMVSVAVALAPNLWRSLNPRTGTLLRPLLVSRPPGSPGSAAARKHIVETLDNAGWYVEQRPFTASTPIGSISMSNIVAERRNKPSGKPRFTLAAHYDSLRQPEGFVGAIDSALPCALLLWLATTTRGDYDLIFFDGEEALQEWSHMDSIYGSKHLSSDPAVSLPQTLVLLDLLGHKSPPVPSWFGNTAHLHLELAAINHHLLKTGIVQAQVVGGGQVHHMSMQDDHLPYIARGVPVLHLIPAQFPPQWHTIADNASILDWASIEAWAYVLQSWLAPAHRAHDEL